MERCKHEGDVEFHTTGDYHFDGGEVWDDIVEHVICATCGDHIDCESGCEYMKRPLNDDDTFPF